MEFKRLMYVRSVSSTDVLFQRQPNSISQPDADPGAAVYDVRLTTGNASAATASTTVFLVDCATWEVTFRKLG